MTLDIESDSAPVVMSSTGPRKLPTQEIGLTSNFNFVQQSQIVQERFENSGLFGAVIFTVHYSGAGERFRSTIDLPRLRLFCRKVAYNQTPLATAVWTRNAPVDHRPRNFVGLFSDHEYADLMVEFEKHEFARRSGAGKNAPRKLTAAGTDFCHHVVRHIKTVEDLA